MRNRLGKYSEPVLISLRNCFENNHEAVAQLVNHGGAAPLRFIQLAVRPSARDASVASLKKRH
jgi:hypothetical protein